MDSDIREIIISFNDAPEAVQQAIYYDEVSDTVAKISEEWRLSPEITTNLENAVCLLLLGFIKRSDLGTILRTNLELESLVASGVLKTIDEELLGPILDRIELPEAAFAELDELAAETIQKIAASSITAEEPVVNTNTDPAKITTLPSDDTISKTPVGFSSADNGPILSTNIPSDSVPKKTNATPELADPANSHVAHPDNQPHEHTHDSKNTPGLRTMAKDMNRAKADFILDTGESAYQSKQSDLTSPRE